jgi:hypothetical protein
MKKLMTVIALVMGITDVGNSQTINWRSLRDDQSNVVQLNVGYDFGATAQLGYSRSFTIGKPVIVGLDYSIPMGSDLLDDFKAKLGGQIEIVQIDGFSATIKISSIFRRYQTELVRIESFGSDFGALAGYYVPTWFVAGEFGFDKSITSHLTHSDIMRAMFPGIKDGWYIPSGGHYYYGVQAGKTVGESFELSLRVGGTNAQANDENAVVPLYLQLGLGMKF